MILEYFSTIKDGKMQRNTAQLIANDIKHFEGKRVVIKIEKLKSSRSSQQNRYWWLAITILAKEIGYKKEECHEILKYKFLKREKVNETTGEIFEYLGSTAKLSKSEFADLVSDLIRFSAETFNVIIPLPGEQLEIE